MICLWAFFLCFCIFCCISLACEYMVIMYNKNVSHHFFFSSPFLFLLWVLSTHILSSWRFSHSSLVPRFLFLGLSFLCRLLDHDHQSCFCGVFWYQPGCPSPQWSTFSTRDFGFSSPFPCFHGCIFLPTVCWYFVSLQVSIGWLQDTGTSLLDNLVVLIFFLGCSQASWHSWILSRRIFKFCYVSPTYLLVYVVIWMRMAP